MITFLPYPTPQQSAEVLDIRRLAKQRIEGYQLLNALLYPINPETNRPNGWGTHPCTRMWRGYELSLAAYVIHMCQEWVRRGCNDNMGDRVVQLLEGRYALTQQDELAMQVQVTLFNTERPWWMGNENLHSNHRAILLGKASDLYGHLGWLEEPISPDYWWPIVHGYPPPDYRRTIWLPDAAEPQLSATVCPRCGCYDNPLVAEDNITMYECPDCFYQWKQRLPEITTNE